MAVTAIAAAVTVAATSASIASSRNEARKAHQDQMDQVAQARTDQKNSQIQADVTRAARAARQRQLALQGGGYDSTISTSPLGLSGDQTGGTSGGTQLKSQLGQ